MTNRALEYLLTQPLLCTVEAAEMAARVAEGNGDPELVATRTGMKIDGAKMLTKRDGVSILSVRGPISRYASMLEDICPVTSVESLAVDLAAAVNDPSTRAILLDVDSPGGEAKGIAELAGHIRAADAIKPVTAYVGGDGCSGAYWLASAASEVVCAPTAMLGSIGVVSGFKVNPEKPGVKTYEFISTKSPLKRADPETESGKASLQKRCDDLCEVFVAQVATLRGLTPETVESDFGRGGVLIGQAAVDVGMADSIGDYESTLARLSRGDRLARPKPKSRPKMAASSKGMTMNPFNVLANLWKTDPDAVKAAMAETGDTDENPFAGKIMPATLATLRTDPVIDEAALRTKIEAELKAKADGDARATLAKFFSGQAAAYIASQVKAGKLTPADGPLVAALYTELALSDHASALTLADGTTADRLSLLTTLVDRKPTVAWTTEHVGINGQVKEGMEVLQHRQNAEPPKVDADRVKAMLASTAVGKTVLAHQK